MFIILFVIVFFFLFKLLVLDDISGRFHDMETVHNNKILSIYTLVICTGCIVLLVIINLDCKKDIDESVSSLKQIRNEIVNETSIDEIYDEYGRFKEEYKVRAKSYNDELSNLKHTYSDNFSKSMLLSYVRKPINKLIPIELIDVKIPYENIQKYYESYYDKDASTESGDNNLLEQEPEADSNSVNSDNKKKSEGSNDSTETDSTEYCETWLLEMAEKAGFSIYTSDDIGKKKAMLKLGGVEELPEMDFDIQVLKALENIKMSNDEKKLKALIELQLHETISNE